MSKNCLALYIRLSKEDENEGESNSIQNQRDLLRSYLERDPDLSAYEVVEFCDDGYSGTNFDRPGIKALLEQVRAGNIRCIIVKDLSRFGRNYIDVGDYLEQIFPFLGVRFISVNDRLDNNDFDGTTGGLAVGFSNLLYSLYSKDLSQKVRSAKKARMEEGAFISSLAPYGYKKSPQNRTKLVIDEKAAAIVRRIFAMATEGKNAVQIANILNSEHIPTPYAYKRLMGCERKFNVVGDRNYWRNTTVLTIIRDERYTGKMINGKTRSPIVGCKHGKRVPKSEWIIVPNTHEAIISQELFASVQDRFSAPKRIKRHPPPASPLLGKVRCASCRHAMRRSNSTPAMANYSCESPKYVSDSKCTKDRIPESDLVQAVLSVIHTQMKIMLDMQQLIKNMRKKSRNDLADLTEQIRKLQATCSRLKELKIRTYEQYKGGALDMDSYANQKANMNQQIAQTDAQITKLKAKMESSYYQGNGLSSLACSFGQYVGFTELSKEIADTLIDSIYVYGSEAIEIVWNHEDGYERLVQSQR